MTDRIKRSLPSDLVALKHKQALADSEKNLTSLMENLLSRFIFADLSRRAASRGFPLPVCASVSRQKRKHTCKKNQTNDSDIRKVQETRGKDNKETEGARAQASKGTKRREANKDEQQRDGTNTPRDRNLLAPSAIEQHALICFELEFTSINSVSKIGEKRPAPVDPRGLEKPLFPTRQPK